MLSFLQPSGQALLACSNMTSTLQNWGTLISHPKSFPGDFQARVKLRSAISGVLAMTCVWESTTVIVSFNSKHKGSMLKLRKEPPWEDLYHVNEEES